MVILLLVVVFVFYFMLSLLFSSSFDRNLLDGHEIEFVWTVFPCFLLLFIGLPSLKILYLIDDFSFSCVTFRSIGYQWY